MIKFNSYSHSSGAADGAASFLFDASAMNYLESSGNFINDYVSIPGVHTFSFWINMTAPADSQYLFEHYDNNNNRYYIEFTNAPLMVLRFRGLGVNNQATCADNIYDGAWHHVLIVGSNNYTTNPPKIYIDGTSRTITPSAVGNITGINTSTLYIGCDKRTSLDLFDGYLDQFAFWDSDQSSNIADIYNGGTPADLEALVTPPDLLLKMSTEDNLETSNGVIDSISGYNFTAFNMTNAANIDTSNYP